MGFRQFHRGRELDALLSVLLPQPLGEDGLSSWSGGGLVAVLLRGGVRREVGEALNRPGPASKWALRERNAAKWRRPIPGLPWGKAGCEVGCEVGEKIRGTGVRKRKVSEALAAAE